MSVELFTRDTIAALPWPDTVDGRYARAYLGPLVERGPEVFVDNLTTTYGVLLVDGQVVLPFSVNDREYANSYVCSPYTHYVTYAKEELRELDGRVLRAVLAAALTLLGVVFRVCRMNRVVLVNNWLLSTNLYPPLRADQIAEVTAFLVARFPRHAIGFCSVDASLAGACAAAGCELVPGRRISRTRPGEQSAKHRKRWRRDLHLIARRGYRVVGVEPSDVERVVDLYGQLYLDKYSRNNPRFTAAFVRETLLGSTITYLGLTKDGRLDGVLGYFVRDGVLTTPVFGYDRALPQRTGLYRMLSAVVYDVAAREGLEVNDSAGAAGFKRLRGAVAEIEHRAVHVRHLPPRQRIGWQLLAVVLRRVAVPLLEDRDL